MKLKIINLLKKYDQPFWIGVGIFLLCLIAFFDYFTGSEVSFSLFYTIPIGLLVWASDWKTGLMAAFTAGGIWLVVDILTVTNYSMPIIRYWNAIVRLGFFLITVLSINLIKALEREKSIARTDYVTGAFNSRYFHEFLQIEINRSIRYSHPFSVVYLDADNFKTVNDLFGHKTGDEVLRIIVKTIHMNLRNTDVLARMGGDEFAILLPETDAEAVKTVILNIQAKLAIKMKESKWSITLSIGVVTFIKSPQSADLVLEIADKIMYEVKNKGKNNAVYMIQY
jgi:diguanylate cyclase (GGDEF)-like protein